MTVRSLPILLALCALLVAPRAIAGTPEAPEILDGVGEATPGPILPGARLSVPEIDLTKVWLRADDAGLHVAWEVVDLRHRTLPWQAEGMSYHVAFVSSAGESVTATISYVPDSPLNGLSERGWRAWGGVTRADGTGDAAELPWAVHGNVLEVAVPRAWADGTLTQLRAVSFVLQPDGTGGWTGGGNVNLGDVAPDEGYGRDFEPE